MKNKLINLNNHLFAQMERLSDEDLKGDALKEELNRANAVAGVAKQIIAGGSLALKAQMALTDVRIETVPKMLESESK